MAKPHGRILVGCNESFVTQSLKLVLADSCEVTERASFAEVVHEAITGGFDVVIVYGNCVSPPRICEGGLLDNTTLAIKTIRASRTVTIVALTSMAEWCEPLRAAGADVCFETPFDLTEFRQTVTSCLQRRV